VSCEVIVLHITCRNNMLWRENKFPSLPSIPTTTTTISISITITITITTTTTYYYCTYSRLNGTICCKLGAQLAGRDGPHA